MAIDSDYDSKSIFWSDVVREKIYRTFLESENSTSEVIGNLNTPDGIAVDWVNKKLYWTDTGTKRIEVCDYEGRNRLHLVTTGLDEPRTIALYPAIG